jgi:hypothetical protein
MGDDGGGDGGASSAGFSYFAVFHNYPLVAALLGFAVAQSIKFFVTRFVRPLPPPPRDLNSNLMGGFG